MENPQGAADSILLLIEGMKMVNEVMLLKEDQISGIFHQIKEMLGIHESESK